jgi:hypothetical protein
VWVIFISSDTCNLFTTLKEIFGFMGVPWFATDGSIAKSATDTATEVLILFFAAQHFFFASDHLSLVVQFTLSHDADTGAGGGKAAGILVANRGADGAEIAGVVAGAAGAGTFKTHFPRTTLHGSSSNDFAHHAKSQSPQVAKLPPMHSTPVFPFVSVGA